MKARFRNFRGVETRKLAALALLVLGYAAFGLAFSGRNSGATRSGTDAPRRLLGPAAELLADIQWIRFTRARLHGEYDRALLLAESALALEPESTDGWDQFASHLATFHGSLEREPDPHRRQAWFEAGIEVTRRGAATASDPGKLALCRALLYMNKLELDPETDPGGPQALVEGMRQAFTEARALGVGSAPSAEAIEAYAKERSGDS